MHQRSFRARLAAVLWMLLLLLPLGVSLPACGGGDGETSDNFDSMPGRNRPRRDRNQLQAAAATPAGSPGEVAPSSTSPGITRRTFPEAFRDPFVRPYPEEDSPTRQLDVVPAQAGPTDVRALGPLAPYAIEELQLQGIMTRSARPVAMFQTPDGSLSTFAYIGDAIGPNAAGRIEDIQPNQIVVVYEAEGGAQRRTVVPLRDPRLDIEADFERY